MNKSMGKKIGTLAFFIAIVVCVCLFAQVISLASGYSAAVNSHATDRAVFYSGQASVRIIEKCNEMKLNSEFVAGKLSELATETETREEVKRLYVEGVSKNSYFTLLYLKDGKFLNPTGNFVEYSRLDELKTEKNPILSEVFQYENTKMTIAAFCPTNGGFAEGVALLFNRADVSFDDYKSDAGGKSPKISEREKGVKLAEFALLLRNDGKPLDKIVNTESFKIDNEPVQSGILKQILSFEAETSVARAILDGKSETAVFRFGTEEYVLALNALGEENGNLFVMCAYKISVIYGEGYGLMTSILATLAGLAVAIAVLTATILISRIASDRKIYNLEMVDAVLNCATPKKFQKDLEEVLKRHKTVGFAITSLKINNYVYVYEKFGDDAAINLAKFATGAIKHALFVDETFAYSGEGEFLLLLYFKDRKSFTDRLNGLYLRLASFTGLEDEDYKVSASFSVYVVEKDLKQTPKQMIDKLKFVKDSTTVTIGSFSANFYEDMLRENRIRKAEIEGKMESALENSEFHLFYQPKYNLRTKRMDGSEILIRWYDPKLESYRVPSVFLPVFEEDGFICKIDRFVLYKACENLAERVKRGKICYPVSVNVSRVTAIQPDFADYYIRIKNKFNVKDGFITLEFTESFAYENYDYLSEIVGRLHDNGFLCSIDDFGTGYSSYNILKTIAMDEIKLDKFFLGKGLDEERDRMLLKSVIEMIKRLGMKVTQEGVESRESFELMQTLGCDVIQGYFFAKPMKYVDYCEFIDNNFEKSERAIKPDEKP